MAPILVNETVTHFSNLFVPPTLRRLHMKFEQNWLMCSFRGEVVLKMLTDGMHGRTHARTDGRYGRRTKSDHNSSSWAKLRWAKKIRGPRWPCIAHLITDKFRVNWSFSSKEEVQYICTRWRPILDFNQNDFSSSDILILPMKFRVKWPFGSG